MSANKDIMVSIVCNAYNHEKYIADALDSFINQVTDFDYEILVHDDASTDGTAKIISDYAQRYPDLIKPILQTVNQHSQGIRVSIAYQYPRAQGKYIAICEGDDYWTDTSKLQKQFDAMEAHPEIDICAHGAFSESGGVITGKRAPSDTDTIFTARQVIAGGGGFVATNSLMLRPTVVNDLWEFQKPSLNDYVFQIRGSLRNGMLYMADCMAVYRVFTASSWSALVERNNQQMITHKELENRVLEILDEETEHQYHDVIKEKLDDNSVNIFYRTGQYRKILNRKYRQAFRKLDRSTRIKVRVLAVFPWLAKIKRSSAGKSA